MVAGGAARDVHALGLTGQEISWSRPNSNTNCPNNGPIPTRVYDGLGGKPGPVMAREFRLNILDAADGPTINEIDLSLR
jgi:hypothetical protein